MSGIVKTEALVLSKLNYGDTSSIVQLFTKEFGRISAILKGGRSPKSKIGLIADPMNLINVVIYNKESREVQLISSAELSSHYPRIKEDFDKLKYAHAVLELIKKLLPEHEANDRIFRGTVRILSLLDTSNDIPSLTFARFFMFLLTEVGYQLQMSECAGCGRTNLENTELSYNYEIGILCDNCRKEYLESFYINPELFKLLSCLKHNSSAAGTLPVTIERALVLMEQHLKYHVPDFKGIQSFQLFK